MVRDIGRDNRPGDAESRQRGSGGGSARPLSRRLPPGARRRVRAARFRCRRVGAGPRPALGACLSPGRGLWRAAAAPAPDRSPPGRPGIWPQPARVAAGHRYPPRGRGGRPILVCPVRRRGQPAWPFCGWLSGAAPGGFPRWHPLLARGFRSAMRAAGVRARGTPAGHRPVRAGRQRQAAAARRHAVRDCHELRGGIMFPRRGNGRVERAGRDRRRAIRVARGSGECRRLR